MNDRAANSQPPPSGEGPGSPPEPSSNPFWLRIRHAFDLDRAIAFALALRLWQLLSGFVTLLLVARYFSRELQGYFYTFWSLVALQSFLELGFSIVILNTASHEWAQLHLDGSGHLAGDPQARSRLISLGRLAATWYAIAGLLFVMIVGAAGSAFLARKAEPGVEWLAPWIGVVLLSGVSLIALPFYAILEGCGQIATVNQYRFWQAITGSAVMWGCLCGGFELWTAAALSGVRVIWDLLLIVYRYRNFIKAFRERPLAGVIPWRDELWPRQWRIAIQGVFVYFSSSLLVPVLWQFRGPIAAGQMGMSWNILSSIQAGASAWIQARSPRFGMLIAKRDYAELDRQFNHVARISVGSLAIAAVGYWGGIVGLNALGSRMPWAHSLAERFLDPTTLALFAICVVLQQVPQCLSYFIRAHKQETLLVSSVTFQIANGLLVCLGSWKWGARGAAVAMLTTTVCILLPWQIALFRACRSAIPR